MGRLLVAAAILAVQAGTGPAGPSEGDREGTLYFFFSPDTPAAPAAARTLSEKVLRRKGAFKVRPVLLIEDWKAFRKPTEESILYRTVRELGGRGEPPGIKIPVFDGEGLRLARAWRLTRLPAFVLVAHGKAHVVYGTTLDISQLLECGR